MKFNTCSTLWSALGRAKPSARLTVAAYGQVFIQGENSARGCFGTALEAANILVASGWKKVSVNTFEWRGLPGTPDSMITTHSMPSLEEALSTPEEYEVIHSSLGWSISKDGGMSLCVSKEDALRVVDAQESWMKVVREKSSTQEKS